MPLIQDRIPLMQDRMMQDHWKNLFSVSRQKTDKFIFRFSLSFVKFQTYQGSTYIRKKIEAKMAYSESILQGLKISVLAPFSWIFFYSLSLSILVLLNSCFCNKSITCHYLKKQRAIAHSRAFEIFTIVNHGNDVCSQRREQQ